MITKWEFSKFIYLELKKALRMVHGHECQLILR